MKLGKLSTDTGGGIEGLPLQLLIAIVVGTMGIGIIVGWMGNIDSPQSVGDVIVEPADVKVGPNNVLDDFEVTVMDQSGNLLEGAMVILEGLNAKIGSSVAYATTDENGTASFSGVSVSPSSQHGVYEIHLRITKSGYTESTSHTLMVIR